MIRSSDGWLVKVELRADDGTWCDMTRPVPVVHGDPGVDRLLNTPRLQFKTELESGRFSTGVYTLVMKNDDGFFDRTTPVTVYDDAGDPHTVSQLVKCRVRLSLQRTGRSHQTAVRLGVGIISSIETDARDRVARLRIVGLERALMEADASMVKAGESWISSIPTHMLVERLVRHAVPGAAFEGGGINRAWLSWTGSLPTNLGRPGTVVNGEWKHTSFVPLCMAPWQGYANRVIVGGFVAGDLMRGMIFWFDLDTGESHLLREFSEDHYAVWYVHHDYTTDKLCWIRGSLRWGDEGNIVNRLAYIGSASITGGNASETLISIWLTSDVWRLGNQDGNVNVIGWAGSDQGWNGENAVLPFEQQIYSYGYYSGQHRIAWMQKDLHSVYLPTSPVDPYYTDNIWTTYKPRGDIGFSWVRATDLNGSPAQALIRYSLTPWPRVARASNGRIFWVYLNRNDVKWRVKSYDIATGQISTCVLELAAGTDWPILDAFFRYQITAWDVIWTGSQWDAYFWVTNWADYQSYLMPWHADQTFMRASDVDGGNVTPTSLHQILGNRGQLYTFTWLSLAQFGSTIYAFGSVLDREMMAYGLWLGDSSGWGNMKVMDSGDPTEPWLRSGLPISGIVELAGPAWGFLDSSTGTVWMMDYTGALLPGTGPPVHLTDTMCVSAEGVLTSGLSSQYVVCICRRPVYWPFPYQSSYLGNIVGSFDLYWWSSGSYAVTELADLEGLTVHEALEQLASFCGDYVFGFNLDGEFFFKPRTSSSQYTAKLQEESWVSDSEIPLLSATKRVEHDNIRNAFDIAVWTTSRNEINVTYTQHGAEDKSVLIPQVVQLDNRKKRVILRCMQGGTIGEGSSNDGSTTLLFSWWEDPGELITVTIADLAPMSTYLQVEGITDTLPPRADRRELYGEEIRVGDVVVVAGYGERTIASFSGSVIVLSSSLGGNRTIQAGTTVRITQKWKSGQTLSEEGVGALGENIGPSDTTFRVTDASHIRIGMVIRIDKEYMEVTNVELGVSDDLLEVVRGQVGTAPASHSSGAIIAAFVNVKGVGHSYEVGATGFVVSWSHVDTTLPTMRRSFVAGERIVIESSGQRLERSRYSRFVIEDDKSVALYGRQGKKVSDNRFVTMEAASRYGQRLLGLYAYPYAVVRAEIPGLWPELAGETITIQSSRLFPTEPLSKMDFVVRRLQLGLDSGRTVIEARSVNPVSIGNAGTLTYGGWGKPYGES
jgi:hypothetical protein